MATKEEILGYIKLASEQNVISIDEIQSAYSSGKGLPAGEIVSLAPNNELTLLNIKDKAVNKKMDISEVLSYVGGGIVFLGIVILLTQNWSNLSFFTKVFSTLGAGIAAYIVGILFMKDEKTEPISNAFYLISALVVPVGISVVLGDSGFGIDSYGLQTMIAAISFGMYFASYLVFKKNIFVLFSVIFGTWLFFGLTSLLVSDSLNFDTWEFYQYRFVAVGISYLLLGHSFSNNRFATLSNSFYGFGSFMLLCSALILGGWSPNQNIFWELIYSFIVIGALYASVATKNNIFLLWGTIFLMIYILKITSEYFTGGLGWPLSLVIAGLSMIGVGYMSINIKNNNTAK